MCSNKKLLRRPRPYIDESLIGYIARLADTNYYPSPNYILKISQLRVTGIYSNIFISKIDNLCILSQITEVEASILWAMAFSSTNSCSSAYIFTSVVKAFGENISTSLFNKTGARFCPICWQTKAYYSQVWHLSRVTVCPFHKCFLIDTCYNCNNKIKFLRPRLFKCQCGFDFRDSQINIANIEEFALSFQIYKLCQVPEIESINYNSQIQDLEAAKSNKLNNLSDYNYDLFEGLIAKKPRVRNDTFFPLLGLEKLLNFRTQMLE